MRKGQLRGAAIDVFPREPGSEQEPFESPLIGLENVILTPPHVMSLEDSIAYINDDELVEITPKSIRLRKR